MTTDQAPVSLDGDATGWKALFLYAGGRFAEVTLEPTTPVQDQWDAIKTQVTHDAIVTEQLESLVLFDANGDPIRVIQVQTPRGVS